MPKPTPANDLPAGYQFGDASPSLRDYKQSDAYWIHRFETQEREHARFMRHLWASFPVIDEPPRL